MSNKKTINLVIFGIGNVGNTLVNQILEINLKQNDSLNLHINVPIITNSKKALFDEDGISKNWKQDFEKLAISYSLDDVINYVLEHNFENLIAIDATASNDIVQHYIPLIKNGFHIISANKIANTLSQEFYQELRTILEKNNKTYLYETNVGAGLPVIETIKNLYQSGEEIEKIRGVFSGSLSYVFNTFSNSNQPFSKVLLEADELGLTEPDAREDLSGNDVARKLLILARELQIEKEINEVTIENLVPINLNGKTTLSQFQNRIGELDEVFYEKKRNLNKNEVLRYVGELDIASEKLEVKLISENTNSTLGQLKGADSVFEIYSKSYGKNPLVIQGAGAGKEVTARGVLSDIIKLSKNLN